MALLHHTNTFFMQRPPVIPTLLFCLETTVIYKYNNVNYALFLCSLGRLASLPLAILPIPPDSPLAASSTERAQPRNVAGQLGGARQAREDREQQNGKEKEQSVWTVLFFGIRQLPTANPTVSFALSH